MKLFCKDEMRRLEDSAAEAGVSLKRMMANAGKALADEAVKYLRPIEGKRVVLLCGKGNNGGDGFICARELSKRGAQCSVVLCQGLPAGELAEAAFEAMPGAVKAVDFLSQREEGEREVSRGDMIIDCVFGFSFRGEMPQEIAELLTLASGRECVKISADLPSGAECDTGRVSPGAFRADVTVTFTAMKPANCCYPAKEHCGKTVVRQVGVPAALLWGAETRLFLTDGQFAAGELPELLPQSNKGSRGRLLLVCGSYGMAGACIMAAKAALHTGVGLLHIVAEERVYPIIAQAVPEAIFTVINRKEGQEENERAIFEALRACTACLIGCGLGKDAEYFCPLVFAHCERPLIIDADAINYCAKSPEALEGINAPFVLTPHPGEMARLCRDEIPEIQGDRLGAAREKARETGGVVALKGAATVIAGPDGRCAINSTGNPGMAKGGSGDVLAGIIGSLAAQGVSPFEAAAAGAYIHGRAGDICAEEYGQRAMLPTDLIRGLMRVFKECEEKG